MPTFILIMWLGSWFLIYSVVITALIIGLFISAVIICGMEWPFKPKTKA